MPRLNGVYSRDISLVKYLKLINIIYHMNRLQKYYLVQKKNQKLIFRISCGGAAEMSLTRNHEVSSSIPRRAQWVKDLVLLRAVVAMEEAGSCSSDWTPSLGTSICHRCSPKKQKQKKKIFFSFIMETLRGMGTFSI